MQCYVYVSSRKPDTYLWLSRRDDLAALPESLVLMLGDLTYVLEVELSGQRQLPHENPQQILEHLRTQGWHLQLPPQQTLAAASHVPNHGRQQDDRRDE